MIRSNLTIAISSAAGDPRLERTWSGTPLNLLKALEEHGATVVPIDASLSRPIRVFCRIAQRMMGYTGHTDRGPFARRMSALRTERACFQARVKAVLHTGTLDLPGTRGGKKLERYLMCDSTWNLAARYSTEVRRYSDKSLHISDKLERKALEMVRFVFSIAHYVKDNLISHYRVNPDVITVVGTGRGKIAPFYGKKDYGSGPILFVAKERFEEKGGGLLLEGFRIASKKNPSLKLVLAGKAVEGLAPVGMPNVRVAGHVAWEELQRLFEEAVLFAMPAYNEPWGLVYLEALACKTPVLGLARNSLPEITHNGQFGFLVERPDAELIADALLRVSTDSGVLERMGLDGQKYCLNTFSWERTARAIFEKIKADE